MNILKAIMKTDKGVGNVILSKVEEPICDDSSVKIRVVYSGICGTDLHILHDTFKNYPPVILGHEFSGIVEEIGEGIKNINIGDRVTVLPSTASVCGECTYCNTGQYVFCDKRRGMGYGVNGSFTKYVSVREDMVYKIPDYVSLESAALCEPLACVVNAMEELDNSNISDTLLLSGPGPLGLVAAALLTSSGQRVIVAGTDIDKTRLDIAKNLGVDYTVNIDKEDLNNRVMEITENRGVDLAIECAGHQNSINACIHALGNNGRLLQLGIVGKEARLDYDQVIYKQIKIQGSVAHSLSTWVKVMKLLKNNRINLDKIITHKIELDEWEEAIKISENKQSGKILLYHK